MVVFVVGEPGIGKTTLVRRLLDADSYLVQKPKWTVGERICAAGHYTGDKFDGADTVPYNGVKDALAYWSQWLARYPITLFDGDRFSNAGVVDYLRGSSHEVGCIYLKAPEEVAASRRLARGSKQNPSWVKGRATKAERFSKLFTIWLQLDATSPPEVLEGLARSFIR